MSFSKEQSYGTLPNPFSISKIITLTSDSKFILKKYDTKPNLVALLDSEDGKIVLKRFGWRSQFHFFISPFMYSRARRSWEIAKALDTISITPKPLFVYTKKKFGFIYENFFITKAIEPNQTFRKFIKNETDKNIIISVLQKLAIMVAKMHDLGIYHRDLTTGNFLIDDTLNIYIVDLNRARNIGKLSSRQRILDISKIHFQNTEVISQYESIKHFFQHYAQKNTVDIDWVNDYWQARRNLVKSRIRQKRFKNYFKKN